MLLIIPLALHSGNVLRHLTLSDISLTKWYITGKVLLPQSEHLLKQVILKSRSRVIFWLQEKTGIA